MSLVLIFAKKRKKKVQNFNMHDTIHNQNNVSMKKSFIFTCSLCGGRKVTSGLAKLILRLA